MNQINTSDSKNNISLTHNRQQDALVLGGPVCFIISYMYLSERVVVQNGLFKGYAALILGFIMIWGYLYLNLDLSIKEHGILIERKFLRFTVQKIPISFDKIERVVQDKKRKHLIYIYLNNGKKYKLSDLMLMERSLGPEDSADLAVNEIARQIKTVS